MILSDFQTNGTNMAMCGGTSMSSFSHGARSDLAYSAPAELSHFVPSMTAMLSEVYPMDESGTSPERTFAGSLMSDENEIGMADVEMEDDQRKVIKIENSEISSLINARSMSEYYNFSSSGDETKAHHFRKRGDIMLSQPKSLPDINCFIQDQNRIGISSASDSCESLNSPTIETTVSIAESSENSDEEPQSPVFTNLTVRSSISQHPFARRWSDNNLHVHSGSEFGDCMGFGYPEESHCVIKQEKGERIPAVSGFSSEPSLNRSDDIGSQTIHHHQHVVYRENPGDLTNSSECSQVLAPKLEKVDPTNIYLGHTSVTQAHPPPCLGLKNEPPQTDTPQTTFSHNPELHPSTHSPTANYPNTFITVTSLPCTNHQNGEALEGRIQYHHQHEQEQRIPKVENLVSNGSQDYSNQTCSYETLSYLDIENLVGPCIEEMKGIILKEVIKDVDVACSAMQLCPDPRLWSEEQVKKWVNWTVNQYNLPFCDATSLEMSGRQLCDLSESEMRALAPKCGDFLHAHLEIWTTVVESSRKTSDDSRNNANTPCVTKQEEDDTARLARYFNQKPSFGPHNSEQSAMCGIRQDESAITVMTPNHTAGIHLWQFLKELLLQPQLYGQYIRWIDKENGIFKIEDSVEVARLWGIRKNRPAMNYDKLSRSIRQYYKKGIIKKTEVSQRLVYQFVKPVV